ncbi:SymE family type I addiction module toxin [Morganella morganii]|uniref:SymE family type I addiction module toxin n=1 Tax=Morganella TaxID=581 RepID=UPI00370B9CA0
MSVTPLPGTWFARRAFCRVYPILISAITLKGHWLKAAGFETGFTFTVKILNDCLVLIPDSEDIRTIKQ